MMLLTHLNGDAQQTAQHPWLKATKINEKTWRIADGDIDNIYLLEGKDSALLIDTGIGVVDLHLFIKSITSLPIIVVNTHSHPDHSGSNKTYSQPAAEMSSSPVVCKSCKFLLGDKVCMPGTGNVPLLFIILGPRIYILKLNG